MVWKDSMRSFVQDVHAQSLMKKLQPWYARFLTRRLKAELIGRCVPWQTQLTFRIKLFTVFGMRSDSSRTDNDIFSFPLILFSLRRSAILLGYISIHLTMQWYSAWTRKARFKLLIGHNLFSLWG